MSSSSKELSVYRKSPEENRVKDLKELSQKYLRQKLFNDMLSDAGLIDNHDKKISEEESVEWEDSDDEFEIETIPLLSLKSDWVFTAFERVGYSHQSEIIPIAITLPPGSIAVSSLTTLTPSCTMKLTNDEN